MSRSPFSPSTPFGWLTPESLGALPDPIEACVQVLDLQLKHFVAAVLARQYGRAEGEAWNLQRECARLADFARLAGYHHDKAPAGAGRQPSAHVGETLSKGGSIGGRPGAVPGAAGATLTEGAGHD